MIRRYSREVMRQIWTDENKFFIWLQIEILACEARRIPAKDLATIKRRAKFDVKRIGEIERTTNHDVIAFLTNVAENVGPASRHIHEGLTSSDVVDTALAVQMAQSADILIDDVEKLRDVIANKAKKYRVVPMIGRTHGVHAEPLSLGVKLANHYDEVRRGRARLAAAAREVAVGQVSGPVGTHTSVPPEVEEHVCRGLELAVAEAATQVLARDRHAAFVAALAILGASLERLATTIRLLQQTEVSELEEPFALRQKGSSAMPHKHNPVLSERVCGMARVLRGYAVSAMEDVALWHERDISHSSAERIVLPDSCALLDYMLRLCTRVVLQVRVNPGKMLKDVEILGRITCSPRVLDALIGAGWTRERAYREVQALAERARAGEAGFEALVRSRLTGELTPEVLDGCFDLATYLAGIDLTYRRLGLEIREPETGTATEERPQLAVEAGIGGGQ